MRVVLVLVALIASWPVAARAEQPRGTYTVDLSSSVLASDDDGHRYPSCGGAKVFGGLSTFVVEYADKVVINQREWRFVGYSLKAKKKRPTPDALVIVRDPQSKDRITFMFGTGSDGAALGILDVTGTHEGKFCVDAWQLKGKFVR